MNASTPNIDALLKEWVEHIPEDRELIHVHVGPGGEGYCAEVRVRWGSGEYRSNPVFHPDDGERCLSAQGATLGEALAKLEALCVRKPPERWAFWTSYDLFPYTLGGRIMAEGRNPGNYRIKGYDSYTFKPFAVVEGRDGEALKDALDAIREEHSVATRELNLTFLNRWRATLARYGVQHPNEPRWGKESKP